jgi:iron complex outermembrane receptor protein
VILFFIFLGFPSFAEKPFIGVDLSNEDGQPVEVGLTIDVGISGEEDMSIRDDLHFVDDIPVEDDTPIGDDLVSDTIHMKGLTIHGEYIERFSPGSSINSADSIDKLAFQAYNLNDIISFKNPIYFKSYGNGMLSSISFRGTGASHTAVLWNGINVNQPTIGQSDFSLFPVLAFNNVRIVYGSSSSKFGSDAIGGGILLESSADWDKPLSGSIGQYVGSFNNFLSTLNVKGRVGKKVYLNSKFYRHQNKNDFEYINITKAGQPVENQQNASIFQYGILQDVYINTSSRSQLSVKGWFNYSDREVQPTMVNEDAEDTQKDKSLRLVADYGIQSGIGYFELKGSYLWDYMLYNNASEIITRQYIGQLNYENSINDWEFRFGSNFNHIVAEVDNYDDQTSENRTDIYGGLVNNSLNRWQFSLNVRQTFVAGYDTPLSPSVGLRYSLIEYSRSLLFIKGQAAINYRVPTLNDRYWVPGGRIDLKPEKSRNLDASLSYEYKSQIQLEAELSIYYYNVDNWILWIPGPTYWIPENVRKVEAHGFDISSSLEIPSGSYLSQLTVNYGYSRSIVKESINEDDVGIDNQLPYTPVHMGGLEYRGLIKNWYGSLSMNCTGLRYVTADNESSLPSYYLLNFRAGKNIKIKRQLLSIDFRINNLLNSSYQNMKFRAMPGRNYLIGINFLFNK